MFAISTLLLVAALAPAAGDSLQFQNGNSLNCTVLQESSERVTVLYRSSVLQVSRSDIKSVTRGGPKTNDASPGEGPAGRMPDYRRIILTTAASPWASGLRQIPATVIDRGIMRNVPYKSHRAGRDYEMNVYGDPEAPAGFEIVVHGGLLQDGDAKRNCINWTLKLLDNDEYRNVVRGLSLEKDMRVYDGLTFEVTPSSTTDAYGGWWVSVYSEKAMEAAPHKQERDEIDNCSKDARRRRKERKCQRLCKFGKRR